MDAMPRTSHRASHRALLAVALAASLAGGCGSSTRLVNMWRDPNPPGAPLRNVIVVALVRDGTTRRIWEDGLARELERHGVSATPSYRDFPDASPDKDQLADFAGSHGYDGVIGVHRMGARTEQRYVPGYVVSQPVTRFSPWRDAYYTYYRRVYEPGYVETDRLVRNQVDVWAIDGGGQLVWTGTTETIDPSSSTDVSREITSLIVPELDRSGVIAGGHSRR